MHRALSIVLGPELYWLALYFGFRWLAWRNVPPTDAGNVALNRAVWLAAAAGVPLSFVFFALPGANRWALLARLAVAALVGFNACAVLACDSIKYPEPGRNSGLLGLWMLSALLAFVTWLLAAGVTLFFLRSGAR